ncbi:hypothetical protein SAMN05192564_102358 [Paraburkholderia sartisoli]|uniref:Uncharacterized protein n=1 Tax=Paraburkholderia sartisoli TaxID=83784 RepID=A0A1H4CLK2_9BURK|nr:hypothetical protein SAMN05192564_102358 [Paraburkholderia sartisoli]
MSPIPSRIKVVGAMVAVMPGLAFSFQAATGKRRHAGVA